MSALGIPASNAINMFYKQIIMHRGIPFDVTLPARKLSAIDTLGEEELDAGLEKGCQDMLAGRTKPTKQVFADNHH